MPPVRRRLVFYCHGYDPEAATRYRRLFVAAMAQVARRFGIARHVSPAEDDAAVPAVHWTVTAGTSDWRTETEYEVLLWDDLVRRDFARGWLRRLPLLVAAMAEALRGAVVQRLFRVSWRFALFVVYPWAALAAMLGAAALAGYAAAAIVGLVAASAVLLWAIAIVVAAAVLRALGPPARRAFVHHLLDGWIFSWQQAGGRHAEFSDRLERFARHVVDRVRQSSAEEVLIVGHSTGSTIAVALAARSLALDSDFGRRGPPVALLTIGSCLAIAGFVRTAEPLRRDIARLATTRRLSWVEYQAPQDALNAFGFVPARDLRLELGGTAARNPQIRSARFKETTAPAAYRRLRWNFFRTHFHFLMANDIPGEYDYPMIACGPVALADRIADPPAAVRAAYGAGAIASAAKQSRANGDSYSEIASPSARNDERLTT